MRFLDAFAGIGGFHAGVKQAIPDAQCVGMIEIDKKAREVYLKNFPLPKENVYEDITKLISKDKTSDEEDSKEADEIVDLLGIQPKEPKYIEDLPDFDLLCAGFPCQPFSINRQGNRDFVNEADDRVNLYQYLIEICRIKQPKYILFENVAKLETVRNSEDKLMIDVIISSLRDIGYKHIKYRILDAADFGVAQQRKRIFIVACRSCDGFSFPKIDNRKKIKVREILEEDVKSKDYKEVFKNKECTSRCFLKTDANKEYNNSERLYRSKKGNAKKSDGSDKKVYKWIQNSNNKWILKDTNYDNNDIVYQDKYEAFIQCPSKKSPVDEKSGNLNICPKYILTHDTPSHISRQADRVYSVEGISRTLATFGHPLFDVDGVWRQLTPKECCRLQGFPDDHLYENGKMIVKSGEALKQLGNAVCVNVIESLVKVLF
tara:strand:+ start:94 stop:1389 length:1296 start_codon:yes stop_codon:yes gene_type:complete